MDGIIPERPFSDSASDFHIIWNYEPGCGKTDALADGNPYRFSGRVRADSY